MRILLIGSGGREHAIAHKLSQSKLCDKLFVAPGNPGTAQCGENVELKGLDNSSISSFILHNNISMLVVGPEAMLVNGLVDYLRANPVTRKVRMIGPERRGARLEGSKSYAKKFMFEMGIPTAGYKEFDEKNAAEALEYIETSNTPIVLKADGLAGGKGVLICSDKTEAKTACSEMLKGKFGPSSKKLIIENYLEGDEFSVFILTNGKEYKILPTAKDYKRIGEGDTGLNTGGMGSVSPVPFLDDTMMQKVEDRIIRPTMEGLEKNEIPYVGFLFFGLIAVNGDPYVIEYNCRMGDPESQVVFPRLENDLVELLRDCADFNLGKHEIRTSTDTFLCTILASGGYPERYEHGKQISGLDKAAQSDNIIIFHAGTSKEDDILETSGGRVLSVVGKGSNLTEARNTSLNAVNKIQFDKKYFRSDIGFDLND